MTMLDRLNSLKYKISDSLTNIKTALTIKGVKSPENLKITEVAYYIRQVYQEDFEFIFNFRDIDQFGDPHVPNTGQSIGGMIGISPSMDDIITPNYSFSTLFDFKDTISYSGTSSNLTNSFLISNPEFATLTIESFNEPTLPEELNYDPTLQTT